MSDPTRTFTSPATGEEQFRKLTLLAADWYWTQDKAFRFTSVVGSERVGAMPFEAMAGRTRWEVANFVPPGGSWDAHRAQLQAHQPFRDFHYMRRIPGSPDAWISINGEPVFDADGVFAGYHGTARDVTQAVLGERALRESEERFRSLTMLSSDWYWEQDSELRFIEPTPNPSAQCFVGGSSVGLRRWEVPGAATLDGRWDEHRALLEAHEPFRDFVYIRDMADGRRHYLSVSGEPVFGAGGSFVGYRGTARDVTERVNAQHEILRLNADLEARVRRRTAQLESANRELQAFGYSIAHDLRAPLATIDGFSQVLQTTLGPQANDSVRHQLSRIRNAVRHMGDLSDGLLALANLSREEVRSEPVDIAVLARQAFEVCCESDSSRQVEVRIAESLPAVGDPRLLAQALTNLLGNAWKFTGHTDGARIEVGRAEHGGQLAFFVRDNGAGFDMAHAGKLFEAFQRLHTGAEFEGTGIGLAIVHKIVARHGGRVWAEATPGQGACFWFTLPDERRRAT